MYAAFTTQTETQTIGTQHRITDIIVVSCAVFGYSQTRGFWVQNKNGSTVYFPSQKYTFLCIEAKKGKKGKNTVFIPFTN